MPTLLRQWRERRGYSVRELARLAGVDFGTVSRIERGVMSPTVEFLAKLALALDVTVRDLIPPGWPKRSKRQRRSP